MSSSAVHCVCGKPAPRVLLELHQVYVPESGLVRWTVWCPSCGAATEHFAIENGMVSYGAKSNKLVVPVADLAAPVKKPPAKKKRAKR